MQAKDANSHEVKLAWPHDEFPEEEEEEKQEVAPPLSEADAKKLRAMRREKGARLAEHLKRVTRTRSGREIKQVEKLSFNHLDPKSVACIAYSFT